MNQLIDLKKRQELLLDLLNQLQEYCQKHQLRFYLAGGTLLGAVRHGGFIPWDDDIDVMMPIEDYNRLISIADEQKPDEPYRFSTPVNNPYHMWPFLKFINHDTILVEPMVSKKAKKEQEKYYGIYIDIFPIYGLPDDGSEREIFQLNLHTLYQKYVKSVRVMNRRPKDNFFVYLVRYILYYIICLPNKIVGRKYYLDRISEMVNRIPLYSTDYWGFTAGVWAGKRDHGKTEYLKKVIDIKFETVTCKILSEFDSLLHQNYGEYMELPPEDKRHIHPSSVRWRN